MDLTRLEIEEDDLRNKLDKLEAFMRTDKFESLPTAMKIAIAKQQVALKHYREALEDRIKLGS